jgi:hypothetical protein
MLVIYHSRDPFPARQAAAIHAGLLPERPPATAAELDAYRERLGGDTAHTHLGLWTAGAEGDRRILALGRASRPDVVWRAFHDVAALFGIPPERFVLQHVGRAVAWTDIKVMVLRRLGLPGLARRVEHRALLRAWADARQAVNDVRLRLDSL